MIQSPQLVMILSTTAHAHFGPHGPGSSLSPRGELIIDIITLALMAVGLVMLTRFIRHSPKKRHTEGGD